MKRERFQLYFPEEKKKIRKIANADGKKTQPQNGLKYKKTSRRTNKEQKG